MKFSMLLKTISHSSEKEYNAHILESMTTLEIFENYVKIYPPVLRNLCRSLTLAIIAIKAVITDDTDDHSFLLYYFYIGVWMGQVACPGGSDQIEELELKNHPHTVAVEKN